MPCDLQHFRDSDIEHSLPAHLHQFVLNHRQVSNEMPNTPIRAGIIDYFLGQARTKEVSLVANVAGKMRKTFFREVQAEHK